MSARSSSDLLPNSKRLVSISTSKTSWPTERMKKVVIHSDGGCHGNPGPGGWAAILEYGPHSRELSGGVPATTNNRMELQAAIEALSALKEPCEVEFYTDSEYVKNEDLWRALDSHVSKHQVKWHWLKGHAGHVGNERCDQLANAEIAKIKKTFSPEQLKGMLDQFLAKDDAEQTSDEMFEN